MNGDNNLLSLIFPQMNPSVAVSTGVAHKEIDKLIQKPKQYKKGEFKPSSILPNTQEKQKVIPIDMDSFAELFKLGFSKDALISMMEDKRFADEIYKGHDERFYYPNDYESDPEIMKKILKATREVIKNDPESQKLYGKERVNKIYDTVLSRIEKGDAPGGLVGYVFPEWNPGDEPGWRNRMAEYVDAFSGRSDKFPFNQVRETVPDTMLFYRESLEHLLGTAYHEPLHASITHGHGYNPFWVTPNEEEIPYRESDYLDDRGKHAGYSQKMLDVAVDKMKKDAISKVGADSLLQMVQNLLNR
jgi:hypothetical protein